MGKNTPLLKKDHLIQPNITITDDNTRKKIAQNNGLPESCSWNDIIIFNGEQQRKEYIKRFELHKTASWSDISEYYCDINRINSARIKGLSENANWSEINYVK
tara:strand:- start:1121 stop:1429 length:309 start_codon:yes stop_codon:yes gene_type:complete